MSQGRALDRWGPTSVFDSYWTFAHERQAMYLRRLAGQAGPWSHDPILTSHRFTNVYRASDRVSQYLLAHVLYDGIERAPADDVLRVLLFKLFNRVDTWETLTARFGEINLATFEVTAAGELLDDVMGRGARVYSAAYIVPPVPGTGGRKHWGHLQLVADQVRSGGLERLLECGSLAEVIASLRRWPGIGPFLSYQLAIDLNYGSHFGFDEDDVVVAGPGAQDGIAKCFSAARGVSPEDVIAAVAQAQDEEFARRNLAFPGLWGRRMKLIDVQNVFCEISKYARAKHPEFAGSSGRTRIKQKYRGGQALPSPVFPPRWHLQPPLVAPCLDSADHRHEEPLSRRHRGAPQLGQGVLWDAAPRAALPGVGAG